MRTLDIHIHETDETYQLSIGSSAQENDHLVRTSHPEDTWFHLDTLSGPHFVLHNEGAHIPKRYLNTIASQFQIYKTAIPRRYTVIYTAIKHVKCTDVPGQVVATRVKKIFI